MYNRLSLIYPSTVISVYSVDSIL